MAIFWNVDTFADEEDEERASLHLQANQTGMTSRTPDGRQSAYVTNIFEKIHLTDNVQTPYLEVSAATWAMSQLASNAEGSRQRAVSSGLVKIRKTSGLDWIRYVYKIGTI